MLNSILNLNFAANNMTDLFENTILCGKCNTKMKLAQIMRNGFILRTMLCDKCGARIIHPRDEQEYNDFINLKKKEFNVKMRYVGNSYTVSIPKEIVNFMRVQEKIMDDMVRLCFEEFGRISLNFGNNVPGTNHSDNSKLNDLNNREIRKI